MRTKIVASNTDKVEYNTTDRDHPKAFFGKWSHSVALDLNEAVENDCSTAMWAKKDYYTNDYQYYSADYLIDEYTVPGIISKLRLK